MKGANVDGSDYGQEGRVGRRRVLRDLGVAAAGGMGIALAAGTGEALAAATAVTAFNVRDYGAVGNGTTDDRAAIQAALNDVGYHGGAVYFPPGNYAVSGPLVPTARTLMYGCSVPSWTQGNSPPGASRIRCHTSFSGAGLIVPDGAEDTIGVTLRNLTLVGAGVGTNVHGIRMPADGEAHWNFEELSIVGFTGSGIYGHLHIGTFRHCYIHENNGWGIDASGGHAWRDVHVSDSHFFYNRAGNARFTGTRASGAVSFVNCRFDRAGNMPGEPLTPYTPSAPGVRLASAATFSFTNCATDANCGNGFEIIRESDTPAHYPRDILLANCRLHRDGTGNQAGNPDQYAGLRLRGTSSTQQVIRVKAVNCQVFAGKINDSDSSLGFRGPLYGVWPEYTRDFQWIGGSVEVESGGEVGAQNWRTYYGYNETPTIIDLDAGYMTLPVSAPDPVAPAQGVMPVGTAYVDQATSKLYVYMGSGSTQGWKSVTLA